MNDMRKYLAYIIIGTWSASIVIILLLMAFNIVDFERGQEIMKSFSSVTSGFVGIVIGYYFTHNSN